MSAVETTAKPAVKKKVRDAQTGKDFDVIPEGQIDIVFAWISAAYSLAVIGFLTWLVLNLLYGGTAAGTIATWLKPLLSVPASKLIFYTAIGGAIGAAVNNLRSFIAWHAEERAFGWRFIWKYLAMPPIGGTLAVLVYGILQGGAAVITGTSATDAPATALSSLSAWAAGTLAGYGSHNVFKWLDDKVNTLFKVDSKQTTVPDVKGKSLAEAQQMVTDAQLKAGDITKTPASSDQVDKVIAQTPGAGTKIDCGSTVALTVGIAGDPTDLNPTPEEEDIIKKNGNPPTGGEPVVEGNAATVGAGADGGQTNDAKTNAGDGTGQD